MSDTAPCVKCQSEISTAAERCPQCGYDPASEGRTARKTRMTVGFFLTATIILAPIGLPMAYINWKRERKASQRGPTDPAP